MDNLILIRVADALHRELERAVLRDVREDTEHRLRLIFEGPGRVHSLAISLRPELPWIGRPAGRGGTSGRRTGRFGAAIARALRGSPVERIEKPTVDRWVRVVFAGGAALVVELATHGANLILLDPEGRSSAYARHPRSARDRLGEGKPWSPPALPSRLYDPFALDANEIDRIVRDAEDEDTPFEILRRRFFGLGTEAARLVVDESARSGESLGSVLVRRLGELIEGTRDPVVLAHHDPLDAAERGELTPEAVRLLPWPPDDPELAARCLARSDAAATAGWYHSALERAVAIERRLVSLRTLLHREIERLAVSERASARDLESFEDPGRHRRWGEALLAGLARARRAGDAIFVPDPYSETGGELAVPARPGLTPQQAAGEHFDRHRKALRGLEQARRRVEWLQTRRRRLEELGWKHADDRGRAALETLEEGMRAEGLPVGLEPETRAARAAAIERKPRLEGVRVFTTKEGLNVLVGRSGRENHRLTFKLAAPEDFWFHARGYPGAHVVLRNPRRAARPSREALQEAAALAAWFSGAREQPFADVQWTRRKYVRRPRGAPPGTVILKRFETVRVRPAAPPADEA